MTGITYKKIQNSFYFNLGPPGGIKAKKYSKRKAITVKKFNKIVQSFNLS